MNNLNLIISKKSSYTSSNGNFTTAYYVDGDAAPLKFYKKIKGKHFVAEEKTGTPLFFSTEVIIGATAPLFYNRKKEDFGIDQSEAKRIASLSPTA